MKSSQHESVYIGEEPSHTPEQAKLWEESYQEFSYEIRDLAKKYPADLGEKI